MHSISTLALSALLACGPLTPPLDAGSSTDDTTTPLPATTSSPPNSPTAISSTTATDPTTTDAPPDPTTTTASTSQSFIPTPDGGTPTIICNQFEQDCPRGQKCMPWADGGTSWNATKCIDVTGDGAPGDPCLAPEGGNGGIDDCAFGSMCWDVDANHQGTCVAQCTGDVITPVCPLGFSCAVSAEAILILCLPFCDPLAQDCPGGDLCTPQGDAFFCVLDASGEMGAVNGPCEFANSCDHGLACIPSADASAACDPDTQGCCQPFCKFPGAPCPNPDQQCTQWYDPMMPIPPGFEDVGICKRPE